MSETATKTAPETQELSYKEFLDQSGQFGQEQRERQEAKNATPEEPEAQVERGIDGKPLPNAEWRELYDQIVASKVNDPDAPIRSRSENWGLTWKQRHELSNYDLKVLEDEAEEQLGRIEAKQESDKFHAALAENEANYQSEMQEFRDDKELYDMFYEAALKQLPEPELTSTDALGQHYEKQQLKAAREKEAARIADIVLAKFKEAHKTDESDKSGETEPTNTNPAEAPPAVEPELAVGSWEEAGKNGDEKKAPPAPVPIPPPFRLVTPPLPPPTPTTPLPTIPFAPVSPEVPHHSGEPTPEEDSGSAEVDDSDEAIHDTVAALEALLRADYPSGDYPDEFKDVLNRAHEVVDKNRWEKIKEGFIGARRWSEVFSKTSATASERTTPENRKRKIRNYVVGASALAAAGLASLGFMQDGEEVRHFEPSTSVVTPDRLPLVDVDSGTQAVEFSNDAKFAERGEGWYKTIRETTGIENQYQLQTVLRDVGPKLIHMGEAYPFSPDMGSYGISKPGRISDEALHLIHDAAKRRGFIK